MSKDEVWKDVLDFEGLYKVSDKGNIYSMERKNSIGKKCGGRMLRPSYHTNGYLQVDLRKDGIRISKLIHRLVAEAFIPNTNSHLEINHKDENKTNNNVENLEWCTREYNMNHGTRNARASQTQSKKVKAINIKTGEVLAFNSGKEAKSKGGYSRGCVSQACQGIYCGGNIYRGHRWSYE